ncbi:hypothetical protein [Pseudonocardia charpentierae]|uniref:Uncharacterized protein n=1 Tax=Pseudonocardia charpentierae TaxID=3075545 RepID=A0ABU2NCU1_9PSEU|nr:hypothetical protein [Pseudonocardia sp. DSM 45834]MDT0351756.1 hypothetical protein [Pseudonocardia sp. DSM 45834]
MDDGRWCALPGCDTRIFTDDGRPERRYCTAAHRAQARRVRREAIRVERLSDPAALAPELPWLREPVEAVVESSDTTARPGAFARTAGRRAHARRHEPVRPRRRHAAVLIAVAGLLAGGYALAEAGEETPPARATSDGRPTEAVPAAPDAAAPGAPPGVGQPDTDRAVLAELRDRVAQVAREARKAEAARG